MMKPTADRAVFRTDYTPYPWQVDLIELRFEIGDEYTRVLSELHFRRNPDAPDATEMALDGQELEL